MKTYSTSQVARKVGVTRQTLHNWIDSGLIAAPEPIVAGSTSIRIWTEAHLTAAKKFKGSLKPGPKKKKA